MTGKRQRAEARGRSAERLAAWSYRLQGFRLLAERYQTPLGELDLVMRRGALLVFIEVKARRILDDALHALHPRQRERLIGAAEVFLRDHPVHRSCSMRFDLVGMQPWRLPHRVSDAWRVE
ncbi:MAG: YraN family protein [Geminicoccaceae bacterium]